MRNTTKNLAFANEFDYICSMSKDLSIIVQLGDVADLLVGYPFRNTCIPGEQGVLTCFLKDVDAGGVLNVLALKRVEGVSPSPSHLASEGDIVFRSRGTSFVAAVVPEVREHILVAAPMILIRVKDGVVLPEYLVWWINGVPGESYFKEHAKGTGIPLISKAVLEKMPLKLPSIEDQQKIIDLVNLNKKEQFLMSEIATRKNLILEREISNYLESL